MHEMAALTPRALRMTSSSWRAQHAAVVGQVPAHATGTEDP